VEIFNLNHHLTTTKSIGTRPQHNNIIQQLNLHQHVLH